MHEEAFIGKLHRLVPSRFPAVTLFDWAKSEDEFLTLAEIEGLTNERLLNEVGDLSLVPDSQKRFGHGYSPIMAAFTHIGCESRFTDGTFGVYYASDNLQTSLIEASHNRAKFMKASNESPCKITLREYTNQFEDGVQLAIINKQDHASMLDEDYCESNRYGFDQRQAGEWGIQYPSVRDNGKPCFAVLRPDALTPTVQASHQQLIWDGDSIRQFSPTMHV